MKFTYLVIAAALTLNVSTALRSDEVTGLTTFQANTPAKASEVNGNFNAVKSAVDNNHQRITVLETGINGKQTRVNGTCSQGKAIATINADGSVTCNTSAGVVAIPAPAFRVYGRTDQTACIGFNYPTENYFTGSGNSCSYHAPVNLPHGATITGLQCTVNDTSTKGNIAISLYRLSQNTVSGSGELPPIVALSASTDLGIYKIASSLVEASKAVVDNENQLYYLIAHYQVTDGVSTMASIASGISVYGCKVNYTL